MTDSSTAKNLKRITESVEAHDASCESKAKAVLLCGYEHDRLGFDHIMTKSGRRVPINADDSLGTGRLRVVCDGYHGPKKEIDQEETVEAPDPAERELVPAGMPETTITPGEDELDPWGPGREIQNLTGFKLTPAQERFWKAAEDGTLPKMIMRLGRSQ